MRRSCDLFNIQVIFLLTIILATIYISTIQIRTGDIKEGELMSLKKSYLNSENVKEVEVKVLNERDYDNLPHNAKVLVQLDAIFNGKQNFVFKTDTYVYLSLSH